MDRDKRDWFILRNWLTQLQRLEGPQCAGKGKESWRLKEELMIQS